MTFLQAAEQVLRAVSEPLTAREITERALRRGLLSTGGKTPVATMTAALYGLPPDGAIRRLYAPGRRRAARGSVRWQYVSSASRRHRHTAAL
jgi:hypothetical protein